MECPKCKEKINRVLVVSECTQWGTLRGNKIIDYDVIEEIGNTLEIVCPHCNENIQEYIKEE